MSNYYMVLTETGQRKLAAHTAGGPPVGVVALAVGDGGGSYVEPSEKRLGLVQEVHRQGLTNLIPDADNPNWLVAETILAPTVGGWTIREVGLIDSDGDLFAYGNFPDSYKPVLTEGSAKELVIRTILETSSSAAITLIVDSSVMWATQSWVTAQNFASQAWVAAQGYATQNWVRDLLKNRRARNFFHNQI